MKTSVTKFTGVIFLISTTLQTTKYTTQQQTLRIESNININTNTINYIYTMTLSSYHNDTNNDEDTIQIDIQSLKAEDLSFSPHSIASRKKKVALAVIVSVVAVAGVALLVGVTTSTTPFMASLTSGVVDVQGCKHKNDHSCKLGDTCFNNDDCPYVGNPSQACCAHWVWGDSTCVKPKWSHICVSTEGDDYYG